MPETIPLIMFFVIGQPDLRESLIDGDADSLMINNRSQTLGSPEFLQKCLFWGWVSDHHSIATANCNSYDHCSIAMNTTRTGTLRHASLRVRKATNLRSDNESLIPRSEMFNRTFQLWFGILNLDQEFQYRSTIATPVFYLQGSPGVQRSARSIISNHDRSLEFFESRRERSNFINPRALWGWGWRSQVESRNSVQ